MAVHFKSVKELEFRQQSDHKSIAVLVEEKERELNRRVEALKEEMILIETENKNLKESLTQEKKKRTEAENKKDELIMKFEAAKCDIELEKRQNKMLQEKIDFKKKLYEKMIREMQTQKNQDEIDGPSALIEALKENRRKFERITLEEHQEKIREMTTEINTMKEKISRTIDGYEDLDNVNIVLKDEVDTYTNLLKKVETRTGK